MKKSNRKVFAFITNLMFTIVLIALSISAFYFIKVINNTPSLNVEEITKKKSSKIYDKNDVFIKQLTMEDYENIQYEDLPDVFINALLSCEDVRYFMHEGIDLPRILSALKNDILSMSLKEGASTITQQLIKNMMLTNTKSIERKIQEVYLSYNIEKLYDKKQILEFYCNFVCFDGINHGVSSACYKFFNKPINNVTLPEAALLAGVVNAPSAYSPIYNKQKANERKNTVLYLMEKHGYISAIEKEKAQKITIDDMLITKQSQKDENTYSYQAYIDIIYKQIYEKTSLDPYVVPMEIYSNMDSVLQNQIDEMQENKNSNFIINDELLQFAASIINNKDGSISACFGKKNYQGYKLSNYAYDKLIQPASTIKVLLEYALAFEHLNYNSKQILNDTPYNYPNTNINIKNVDNTYMGELTIADAIGYSRNTTAIKTLKEVIDKIGVNKVIDYLKSIDMMDNSTFSYSYGLGGYTYGVSLASLAAAYSMIARNGVYIEPLSVRKIKLLDGSNKEIIFTPYSKKVLSEQTCFLLIDVLKQVMDDNIWSINDCKPNNVNVYAKTGTTSFDKKIIDENNYPANASKDRLLASFTNDYSIACWAGYDYYLKDKKTYFLSNETKSNLPKKFTKLIYSKIALPNQVFKMPEGLVKAKVVLGSNYLATNDINKDYITYALYKKEVAPNNYFKESIINEKVNFDYFIINNEINFIFNQENKNEKYNVIFDQEKIFGGKSIFVDVYVDGLYSHTIKCEEKIITIPLKNSYYRFDIYYKYNLGIIDGVKETISFIYN